MPLTSSGRSSLGTVARGTTTAGDASLAAILPSAANRVPQTGAGHPSALTSYFNRTLVLPKIKGALPPQQPTATLFSRFCHCDRERQTDLTECHGQAAAWGSSRVSRD